MDIQYKVNTKKMITEKSNALFCVSVYSAGFKDWVLVAYSFRQNKLIPLKPRRGQAGKTCLDPGQGRQ